MKSYEKIAQEVLARRDEEKVLQTKRRKKMMTAAAGVCVVLLAGFGIWKFADWNAIKKQEEKWPEKKVQVPKNTEAVMDEIAIIPRWEEMKIFEQYPEAEFAGSRFSTQATELPEDQVGAMLGSAAMSGYDIYEDVTYETAASLYEISGIASECAVAVQFPEQNRFFVYVNSWYRPVTLKDLVEDLNLKENLSFGSVWYDWREDGKYMGQVEFPEIEDSVIWEMLLADLTPENVYDDRTMYDRALGISVNIPLLGYENISLAVTWDGYITTNILNTGKAFFIGRDKAEAFINYVLEECEGYRTVYVYDEEPIPEVEEELKEEIVEVYTEGYEPEETVKHETVVEDTSGKGDRNTGSFTPAMPPTGK